MILLFYFHQNNKEKASYEVQKFKQDIYGLCSIIERQVGVGGRRQHFSRGRLHYKGVTPLLEACIMGDTELVECLLSRFGASLEDKCSRKNRFVFL